MHAATQFSHPQQEPVAQSSHTDPFSQISPPTLHGAAQMPASNTQTSLAGHGSFSSHWPAWIGTHAATQSSQPGQLPVAQPLQI
jgi:hypothetical protein